MLGRDGPGPGPCAPYADKKAAEELGKQCGRFLGPNVLGVTTDDPTMRPGWDGADRGPESSDPNNRRRTAPADRDLASDRRRAAGGRDGARRDDGDGARRGDGESAGDGASDGKPPVRLPNLDDVLPGGAPEVPGRPAPPAVEDLPNVGGATGRDDGERNEQLMDFLFGS